MSRLDVTEKIVATKVAKGLKWSDVAAKVGLSKEWVTAACLGQMTLTGETIDAATALAHGLVTEVMPAERLIERALGLAADIAAHAGHATRMAKRLLREGQNMKLAPLLELSAAYQALAHHTADHEEAIAAFVEKRAARLPGD